MRSIWTPRGPRAHGNERYGEGVNGPSYRPRILLLAGVSRLIRAKTGANGVLHK